MKATWTVDVKRFYVQTAEKNSKGKPVSVPITQRKIYVTDPNAFLDSGKYRIFRMSRKNVDAPPTITYSLAAIPHIAQNCWQNPTGSCQIWYKDGTDYKKSGTSMTEVEFLKWLTARFGAVEAQYAFRTLETQEPENLAQLAA